MWGARVSLGAGAALLVAASCAVSGFEKVDALPGSDASAGSGGSAGSAGSATTGGTAGVAGTDGGGAGGSAGVVQCTLSTCSPGTNAEPCCFNTSTASVCGLIASEYAACVPPNGAGTEDAGCATKAIAEKVLPGCCMPNGLCGYLDEAHALGCMPVEAFGDPPQACAANPCGELCVAAKAAQCSSAPAALGAYECAEKCLARPAACADELKAVTDCASTVATQCAAHGDPLFTDCLAEQLDVAECEKWPGDCNLYCAMVQTACSGQNIKQYETEEQCRAVCAKLTPAEHAITQELTNSVVCRAQNAALALAGSTPDLCSAAGPGSSKTTGPACGGGDCQSYCELFKTTCPDQFTQDYASSPAACENACGAIPSTPPYDVGDQSGNTVQCRLYWTVQAISDPANAAVNCEKARKTSTQCQ